VLILSIEKLEMLSVPRNLNFKHEVEIEKLARGSAYLPNTISAFVIYVSFYMSCD
jgi:hypothetical protein